MQSMKMQFIYNWDVNRRLEKGDYSNYEIFSINSILFENSRDGSK
jgi:hypothetical protein